MNKTFKTNVAGGMAGVTLFIAVMPNVSPCDPPRYLCDVRGDHPALPPHDDRYESTLNSSSTVPAAGIFQGFARPTST